MLGLYSALLKTCHNSPVAGPFVAVTGRGVEVDVVGVMLGVTVGTGSHVVVTQMQSLKQSMSTRMLPRSKIHTHLFF